MKLKNKWLWMIPAGIALCLALIAGGIFLQDWREDQARLDVCMQIFALRFELEETYPDGSAFWQGWPAEFVTVSGNRTTIHSTDTDCLYIYEDGILCEVEIGDYDLFGNRTRKHYDVRDKLHLYRVMLPEEVSP